jgi:hypothetical protein
VWYHINAKPRPLTSIASKCLLRNHSITTVADMIRTLSRLPPNLNNQHIPNLSCICAACARDRLNSCRNPHECTKEALTCIKEIALKLNPLISIRVHDNLSLTPNHKKRNIAALDNDEEIIFDLTIT